MKKIFLALTLVFVINGNALALSDCPKDTSVEWDNCFGTYTFPDGETYTGGFKNNFKHGQGTYTFPNGGIYIGGFKNNFRHGQGTYTYASGNIYTGGFKNDLRHGQATYTFVNGEI
ncbi:MAG: hypothetical protein P8Q34_03245, partial [Hyphomicrobiales bacterium]|nr:hypothetical protein [Hyphomicrobiales bacterium]